MHVHQNRLLKKGWKKHEVEHLKRVIHHAEQKKHPAYHLIEETLPATIFLVAAAGNVAFIMFLMPIILMLPALYVYLFAPLLGFSFGLIYSFLLKDLIHYPSDRYLIPLGIIALLSVTTIWHLVETTIDLQLFGQLYPQAVSLLYGFAFLAVPLYLLFLHQTP